MIRRPPRSTLFPTRRSSDLRELARQLEGGRLDQQTIRRQQQLYRRLLDAGRDRKSTRLNSSHGYISYAVFCLKKKKPSLNATNHLHIPTLTSATRQTRRSKT